MSNHYKLPAALTALALGTVLLIGSGPVEKGAHIHVVSAQKCIPTGEVWEYVKEWHDGYNVHKYVKIKGKRGKNGEVKYYRDNATGLLVFRDVTKAEYEAAKNATF